MTVEYSSEALKYLKKLDKHISRQILAYMDEVSKMQNPRDRGKALKGNLSNYWRYRSGNYRIVCLIKDARLVVTVLKIADRKEVYR